MPNTFDTTNPIGVESEVLLSNLLTELGFSVAPYKDGKAKEADLEIKMLIELKRDVASQTTGNYAIEYKYKGEASGISTTKADIWCVQTEGAFYLYHTSKLKDYMRYHWKTLKKVKGGDDELVDLILIPRLDAPEPWLTIPLPPPPPKTTLSE